MSAVLDLWHLTRLRVRGDVRGHDVVTKMGERCARPRVLPTLWRGAQRRCPHCGQGPLFVRWITTHEHCRECGLVFVRNQGDTWLFWILMDRIPLVFGIVAIYFGFQVSDWITGAVFFLVMAVPLLATIASSTGCSHRPQLSVARLFSRPVRRSAGSAASWVDRVLEIIHPRHQNGTPSVCLRGAFSTNCVPSPMARNVLPFSLCRPVW